MFAPGWRGAYSFTCRFVIDMVRQGTIFSYIIVEAGVLCKSLSIAEILGLTMSSVPLDSLVVERVLRCLD